MYTPANALTQEERQAVLDSANSAEFACLPPCQIVPALADRGKYIASESTFYRILRKEGQLKHRHASKPAKQRTKPKALTATGPNQVWSWDITYLPTPVRGIFFYLYMAVDLFSRKIVACQVFDTESSERAGQWIQDACTREGIKPGQLTLHSDNGSPMRGYSLTAMLQTLGVMPSFSRPAVSNDNPYIESLFKTVKYCHLYPRKPFANLIAARLWGEEFVRWYNEAHRHSGINFVTPSQRHAGKDKKILEKRRELYAKVRTQNPRRWTGASRPWHYINSVNLNPENLKNVTTETELKSMKKAA